MLYITIGDAAALNIAIFRSVTGVRFRPCKPIGEWLVLRLPRPADGTAHRVSPAESQDAHVPDEVRSPRAHDRHLEGTAFVRSAAPESDFPGTTTTPGREFLGMFCFQTWSVWVK